MLGNLCRLSPASRDNSAVYVRLLMVWLKHSSPFSFLSFNVMQVISSYFSTFPGQIIDLQTDCYRQFDLYAKAWQPAIPLKSSIQVHPTTSRWVVLTDGRLFCSGGSIASPHLTYWRSAYILSGTGGVETLNDMRQARECHGLTQWRNSVYVFGGAEEGVVLSSCESVLLLPGHGWEWRPSMSCGRADFNVCVYQDLLYLCCRSIQAFNPLTNLYLPFLIDLPERSACCAYVKSDVLVVYTTECISKYRVEKNGELLELSRSWQVDGSFKYQSSKPVVDPAGEVVYCVFAGSCWTFEISSGKAGQTFA